MEEEKSLKEILADLSTEIKDMKEVKKNTGTSKWKLPFSARTGMGKVKKRQGYVVFMNIGTNKAVTFIKAPVTDNVALVNNVPHVVEPEDILLWKNRIPLVIIPQWSQRPFSTKDHFKQTIAANQHSAGWEYIMNFILKTQIQAKKTVPTGLIIIGVLAIIGLGFYLFKSGALK